MSESLENQYRNAKTTAGRVSVWEKHNTTPSLHTAIELAAAIAAREKLDELQKAAQIADTTKALIACEQAATHEAAWETHWDTPLYNCVLMLRSVMKREGIDYT